eukprot:7077518-Heterocapsa_arctica.AAC.1
MLRPVAHEVLAEEGEVRVRPVAVDARRLRCPDREAQRANEIVAAEQLPQLPQLDQRVGAM